MVRPRDSLHNFSAILFSSNTEIKIQTRENTARILDLTFTPGANQITYLHRICIYAIRNISQTEGIVCAGLCLPWSLAIDLSAFYKVVQTKHQNYQ